MNILAVIPARGGSKGIPRKNIKPLCGRPLIAWTIDAARASAYPMRVIVSTDDEEIAAVAKELGAEVPFLRPKDISADLSTDVDFLTHALDVLKETEGYEPDIVLRLPPTSPLRTAAHIDQGIKTLLDDPSLDAVRPITEAPKHPYKMWKIGSEGNVIEAFLPEEFTKMKEPQNLPRQVLPNVHIHTGAMDVMRTKTITELRSTSGSRLGYFFMDPKDSVNIDHQIDFDFAEFLLARRNAGQ